MGTILDEIVAYKKEFVGQAMREVPLEVLKARARETPKARDFAHALRKPDGVAVITEVKKASPSAGVIREDFDPAQIARAYQAHGASAISVLTDEKYFQGSCADLGRVRQAVGLPLLRKDFVIDPYQVWEARTYGADAVLLIASLLDRDVLSRFLELAHELGMDAVVEVHSQQELEQALTAGPRLIGINNRDLRTFKTDLSTTMSLVPLIPNSVIIVSESGISTRDDIEKLHEAGVDAVLVGEALMRKEDVGGTLRALAGPCLT